MLAVPLMREGNADRRHRRWPAPNPGSSPTRRSRCCETFADQAVIAIENVRLFNELEARTAELTQSVGELKALGEVGQAVSSTLDLETVLRTIVSRATQLAGMDGGSVYEYDEVREEFDLQAADGLPDELVDALRATPIRKGEGALGRMAVTGEPVEIRDIADEAIYQSRVRELLVRLGYRSVLAVPLLREDHLLGGLVVNRKQRRRVRAAGDRAAARRLRRSRRWPSRMPGSSARSTTRAGSSRRRASTRASSSPTCRTSCARRSTPSSASRRCCPSGCSARSTTSRRNTSTDILESGRHLLSLINDILDLSKIEAGRMELEPTDFDLPSAIENALTLVRERAHRRGIALVRDVDERLGMIRADERKLSRCC